MTSQLPREFRYFNSKVTNFLQLHLHIYKHRGKKYKLSLIHYKLMHGTMSVLHENIKVEF